MRLSPILCAAAFGAAMTASAAQATLLNLGPGSFTPAASVITFDSPGLGTNNPVYSFVAVPDIGDITVSFGSHFVGQTLSGGFPVTLVDTSPDGPLALANNPTGTEIVNDGAPGATSPVLSGSPIFNGPIAVLFSVPVAAVGLKGGFFDAIAATTIEAFDGDGNSLGSITNSVTGFEFYGLAATGPTGISGISFYITGNEPAGFQIDNVTFGAISVVNIPEPASLALFGLGLAGVAALRRRRATA